MKKTKTLEPEFKGSFVVLNEKGLHARPCSELVKLASKFTSRVWIEFGSRRVDGKSLLGLLTLAISSGSEVFVIAQGPDAKEAVLSIQKLAQESFFHDY
jgi:phosphocarrier protein